MTDWWNIRRRIEYRLIGYNVVDTQIVKWNLTGVTFKKRLTRDFSLMRTGLRFTGETIRIPGQTPQMERFSSNLALEQTSATQSVVPNVSLIGQAVSILRGGGL